jgi:hypothetical protein
MSFYSGTIIAEPSLLALYMLSDAAGTNATDTSSHALTGTYNGGFTLAQSGPTTDPSDKSVLLNGSTGFIQCPAGLSVDGLGTCSVEAWINMTALPSVDARLISNSHTDIDNKGIQLQATTGGASVSWRVGFGSSQNGLGHSFAFSINTWYHMVATFDGSNTKVFINTAAVSPTGTNAGTIAASGFAFTIGKIATSSADFFNGRMFGVAFYNAALTPTQITAHYNAATTVALATVPISTTSRNGAIATLARDGSAKTTARDGATTTIAR